MSNSHDDDDMYTGPPARKKFAVEGGTAAEIASGAQRLASELQEFTKDSLEETNIVDLQLTTCRKLREVSFY